MDVIKARKRKFLVRDEKKWDWKLWTKEEGSHSDRFTGAQEGTQPPPHFNIVNCSPFTLHSSIHPPFFLSIQHVPAPV